MKKLKTIPFLTFHTVLGALLGLLAGILYAFGGLLIDLLVSLGWVSSPETPGLSVGTILAFGALIGMPIIFAGFGLLLGGIELIVFTVFARWVSWLELDFERRG